MWDVVDKLYKLNNRRFERDGFLRLPFCFVEDVWCTVFAQNKEYCQFICAKTQKIENDKDGWVNLNILNFLPFFAEPKKSAPHSGGQPRTRTKNTGMSWHLRRLSWGLQYQFIKRIRSAIPLPGYGLAG